MRDALHSSCWLRRACTASSSVASLQAASQSLAHGRSGSWEHAAAALITGANPIRICVRFYESFNFGACVLSPYFSNKQGIRHNNFCAFDSSAAAASKLKIGCGANRGEGDFIDATIEQFCETVQKPLEPKPVGAGNVALEFQSTLLKRHTRLPWHSPESAPLFSDPRARRRGRHEIDSTRKIFWPRQRLRSHLHRCINK